MKLRSESTNLDKYSNHGQSLISNMRWMVTSQVMASSRTYDVNANAAGTPRSRLEARAAAVGAEIAGD